MKFADDKKEEGPVNAEKKLDKAQEEMVNAVVRVKDG